MTEKQYDLVGNIIKFESEDMTLKEVVALFSHLINSGEAWSLQGFYGRTAMNFIDNNILDRQGKLTDHGKEVLKEAGQEIGNNYEMIILV